MTPSSEDRARDRPSDRASVGGIAVHVPWLDGAGRVAVHLPCRHCGYDLRTIGMDAACPECGRSLDASLDPDRLLLADPRRLRRIALAAGWLGPLAVLVPIVDLVLLGNLDWARQDWFLVLVAMATGHVGLAALAGVVQLAGVRRDEVRAAGGTVTAGDVRRGLAALGFLGPPAAYVTTRVLLIDDPSAMSSPPAGTWLLVVGLLFAHVLALVAVQWRLAALLRREPGSVVLSRVLEWSGVATALVSLVPAAFWLVVLIGQQDPDRVTGAGTVLLLVLPLAFVAWQGALLFGVVTTIVSAVQLARVGRRGRAMVDGGAPPPPDPADAPPGPRAAARPPAHPRTRDGTPLPCLACGHLLGGPDPDTLPGRCPECGSTVDRRGPDVEEAALVGTPAARLRFGRFGVRFLVAGFALQLAAVVFLYGGIAIRPGAAAWASQAFLLSELGGALLLAAGHWLLGGVRRRHGAVLMTRGDDWARLAAVGWLGPWLRRGLVQLVPQAGTVGAIELSPVLALAALAWLAVAHARAADVGPLARRAVFWLAILLPSVRFVRWLVFAVTLANPALQRTPPAWFTLPASAATTALLVAALVVAVRGGARFATIEGRRRSWEAAGLAARDPLRPVVPFAAFGAALLALTATWVGHDAFGPGGRSIGAVPLLVGTAALAAWWQIAVLDPAGSRGAGVRHRAAPAAAWTIAVVPGLVGVFAPYRLVEAGVAETLAIGPAAGCFLLVLDRRRRLAARIAAGDERPVASRVRTGLDLLLAACVLMPLLLLVDPSRSGVFGPSFAAPSWHFGIRSSNAVLAIGLLATTAAAIGIADRTLRDARPPGGRRHAATVLGATRGADPSP